jgi:glycosyltransferase involved in cell wall biosynthesis
MDPAKGLARNGSSSLVSILIPAYNHAYFSQALESALNQTYTHTEIIVCDDSGGNRIREIVSSMAGDSGIKYHANDDNLGARGNYLKCFGLAQGKYIKYLNDDDLLDADCVRRMVDVLERFSKVSLVCSRRQLIDDKGNQLPDTAFTHPVVDRDSIIPGSLAIRRMLERQINFIGEPTTALFRRADINRTRPDIMSFGGRRVLANLDVAMWLNLMSRGDLVYLVDVLSYFRMHGEQEQQKDPVRQLCMAAWRQVIQDALRMGVLAPGSQAAGEVRPLPPKRTP